MFRRLKATEIECRVGSQGEGWVTILLYKNARVDMQILDEQFGPMGWQRDHKEINGTIYCGIGIKPLRTEPEEKDWGWVWKWDAGAESNSEAEKGAASDSFKRAATNWGIGRELYTAPLIFIRTTETDIKNGKFKTKFRVHDIAYDNRGNIIYLVIMDDKNKVRYEAGEAPKAEEDLDEFQRVIHKS